jgi:RNA 2',3'-cyclic 3'-phosphodiesterase
LPRSRGVRWCDDDQLHVTLKFLGDVSDEQLPRVRDVLTNVSAQVEPFQAHLGTLGCFPSPRSPRVFWCGIADPAGACMRWVALADPLLAALGFEREARPFTPHVTLGRSKDRDGTNVLQRAFQTITGPPESEMTVDHVVLFESRLLPEGAQYTPLMTVPLGQSPRRPLA